MLQKMMKKMRRNNKKGFTLIELIVVIAILAILAAIMVPSMVGYLNSAKKSTADANARTVYSAAASAAAACIASGDTDDLESIATATDVDGLDEDDAFQNQLATMLGATFEGYVTVTVDEELNVTGTTWQENEDEENEDAIGTYTVGEASEEE